MGTMTITSEALDARTLALVMAWFSPACPIGAFSYSHGVERLNEDGVVADRPGAEAAIRLALTDGSGRSDAILLAHAYRAVAGDDEAAFHEVRTLALALVPSMERREETVYQGNAFATIVDAAWPGAGALSGDDVPLPVAVGAAGALHGVPLVPLAQAFLGAFAANLVSAAVRLVPLGQTDGQRLTATLAPVAAAVAVEAVALPLDAVGGAAIGLDLASMRHECQEVRLFRS